MTTNLFKSKVTDYTKNGIPFLFLIDFEIQKPFVCKLEDLEKEAIYYQLNGKGNLTNKKELLKLKAFPIDKTVYKDAFQIVNNSIRKGDTYLINLTFATKIELENKEKHSLKEVLQIAKSSNKLYFKDQFISFSPEPFIQIKNDKIYTFPMKGTIDASIENAENIILNDVKEKQEHNTIVDLLRNDLAIVSENVRINTFRYIDKLTTSKGDILQVSSEIEGQLPKNWKENFGDILLKLLPAGSISGAPKKKTLEIIKQAEKSDRGYYTGVFGVFDGSTVNSSVLIRFIEKKNNQLFYRSGGGITYLSDLNEEYEELLQKIYIPK